MFKIGDLIIYSAHGICCIDDICKMKCFGVVKDYYVLHPIENNKLKISTPVDNKKVVMLKLIEKDEAEEIIESFKSPGIEWIDISSQRNQIYSDIVNKGNRKEIAKIINTLMRKKHELESSGKKLYEHDSKLLDTSKNIMFEEIAMSLNTTFEEINDRITNLIVKGEE